jgi:hypothetical protein
MSRHPKLFRRDGKRYLFWFAIPLILAVVANYKHSEYAQKAAENCGEKNFSLFLDDCANSKDYVPDPNDNDAVWWERVYIYFGWPTGTTIWALVITFVVIAEQTTETRKAAQASLKQARIAGKAILLQFRPKLRIRSVSLEETGEFVHVTIVVANRGGLPAYIHDGKITLWWLYEKPSKKEIKSMTIGASTVQPGSQNTFGMSLTGGDTLRYRHYANEVAKSPDNPLIRLRCEGTLSYFDDSGACRYMGFSRTHDVVTEQWITSTDTSREYHS